MKLYNVIDVGRDDSSTLVIYDRCFIGVFERDFLPYVESEYIEYPGIYILYNDGSDRYIGQSKSLKSRLLRHDKDVEKSWWDKFVIIGFTDGRMDKGLLDAAERVFIDRFSNCLFNIHNKTDGNTSPMSEFDKESARIFEMRTVPMLSKFSTVFNPNPFKVRLLVYGATLEFSSYKDAVFGLLSYAKRNEKLTKEFKPLFKDVIEFGNFFGQYQGSSRGVFVDPFGYVIEYSESRFSTDYKYKRVLDSLIMNSKGVYYIC